MDDYIGLPSGFLYAGARTVVSSLWPVSDMSTALLMVKMYESLLKNRGKAESLHEAQVWLKNPNNSDEHLRELKRITSGVQESHNHDIPDLTRFIRKLSSEDSILLEDLHKPYYWAGFICTGAP